MWEEAGRAGGGLAGGGFEEVAAADNFRDAGFGVVDYAGELVAGKHVFSPDEEVAKVFACGEGLRAQIFVFEADGGFVGNAESVVDVGLEGDFALLNVKSGATRAGIEGFVIAVFVWCVHHVGHIFATAMAGIDLSSDEELVEGCTIECETLGLVEDWWLPLDSEPCKIFKNGLSEVWL